MGLIVNVFKNPLGDCTRHGISSTRQTVVVVNVAGPFEPQVPDDAVILRVGPYHSLSLVPAIRVNGAWEVAPGHWMNGGNLGACSDSRFTEACARLAECPFYGGVYIHDRQE